MSYQGGASGGHAACGGAWGGWISRACLPPWMGVRVGSTDAGGMNHTSVAVVRMGGLGISDGGPS